MLWRLAITNLPNLLIHQQVSLDHIFNKILYLKPISLHLINLFNSKRQIQFIHLGPAAIFFYCSYNFQSHFTSIFLKNRWLLYLIIGAPTTNNLIISSGYLLSMKFAWNSTHQTRNICIPFVQRWTNVDDVGTTIYDSYKIVLCLLGIQAAWPAHE